MTCTFGNLAAYGQDNMKRLLAYSTIAHAGYMMMPVAAAILLAGSDPAAARQTVAALGFYIAVYLFMNLGAFAVVAFLRNELGSEQLPDYAGLARRSPGFAVCVAIIMFSLWGFRRWPDFAAKFAIFAQTYRRRVAFAGGDRCDQHRLQPVLLSARREDHGPRPGARGTAGPNDTPLVESGILLRA